MVRKKFSQVPTIERSRPLQPRWLSRLSFRRKVALIVGIPSVVAFVGSVLALSRVAAAFERSRTLERANSSSSHLIEAAATQAKERGFASAALSDPTAKNARMAIPGLRQEGDRELDAALTEARPALQNNSVLTAALNSLRTARSGRDLKRADVDRLLLLGQAVEQSMVQSWFEAQTRVILAERVFGSTLFLAQNPYELVIQYNSSIKANVFAASEFAGRERARIGRFIATGKTIPPERLDELQRWRGVVEENLAAIAQLRANPAMSPGVLESIDDMERKFLGDYQRAREAIYLASARGEPYPLTTDEWIAVSTKGIDSILAVSERIGQEAARISRQQANFSLANVSAIAGMMGLLVLAIVGSFFVARDLTRRLDELRAAAERVSSGDYSHPILQPERLGFAGDEFARLAGTFDVMQGQVEAGVERLQHEKAGVETKVQERTRELTVANDRLRALNAEKDTFLAICSHDLKNPLSGVIGLADLIHADAEDPALVREHAGGVLQSADFMFHLVANLLDLGAMEQGKLSLQTESIDLGALITRIIDSYRQRASAKNIALTIAVPAAAAVLTADPRAITQVADNLISNALKFTEPGGKVSVVVSRTDSSDNAGTNDVSRARSIVQFTVTDTGPGLSLEDQTRLFGKYTRLSPKATGGESSTGLGLSIVKQLAEAMGGTVTFQSELGRGSIFTVSFPVR